MALFAYQVSKLSRFVFDTFGQTVGALQVSEGVVWADYGADSFAYPGKAGKGPRVGDRFTRLFVANTSANTLFVLLRAGGTTLTSDAIAIPAGLSLDLPLWGLNRGEHITTISLQGSAIATTASLTAFFS